MKFSPYHQAESTCLTPDGVESEGDLYFSDDSEEAQFPVSTGSLNWAAFTTDTKETVAEAVTAKRHQTEVLQGIIRAWKEQYVLELQKHDAQEYRSYAGVAKELETCQQEQDWNRSIQYEERTNEFENSILETIELERQKQAEQARKDENARQEQARQDQARQERARQESVRLQAESAAAKQAALDAARQASQKESSDHGVVEATPETSTTCESTRAEPAAKHSEEPLVRPRAEQANLPPATTEENSRYSEVSHCLSTVAALKRDVLEPVSADSQLKSFCNRARMKINPRVGQVTNSIEQIGAIVGGLTVIFEDAVKQDPRGLALQWCLNFFCKAIIRQAEGEVMVKPTACYPLAFLVISLTQRYPQLKGLYLCRLTKKCPWIVPYVAYDKGTEAGRKSLGWRRGSDEKYEEFTSYLERQEGIFRLWIATVALELKSSPFHNSAMWTFITRLMNDKILDEELQNVAFAMASTFMEIAGKSFIKIYGSQARKTIHRAGPWVASKTSANARRLQILIEEYQRNGDIGLKFEFER